MVIVCSMLSAYVFGGAPQQKISVAQSIARLAIKLASRSFLFFWFTVVHKNITYIKNSPANFFARLQLQLYKKMVERNSFWV